MCGFPLERNKDVGYKYRQDLSTCNKPENRKENKYLSCLLLRIIKCKYTDQNEAFLL